MGKITHVYDYSKGNVNKFFEYTFLNIYGISKWDNHVWAGQAGEPF
ncbi:hypothetical protein ALNOE001_18560 [Candidatus Methanobinarius endosymbioticus]|uniref:Uncharacterized protein n=1 Tax=Candidatus Methanobinarius endosymbioticus TaxID=2006182 RepID=A0A366M8T8_9EURY|nr:hypothetical protein ALNOE001_18560 [Candidatus Methanobinarius endosymbioticus]